MIDSPVIDITDPSDPRLDDFRNLSDSDRRPDVQGRRLVVAEGVVVIERMLASRFRPHAILGVARRLDALEPALGRPTPPDHDAVPAQAVVPAQSAPPVPVRYRASAEVMAQVVGFHLNRGVLAVAERPAPLALDDVLSAGAPGPRTIAVLEAVNDHENLGSLFRNAAGLGLDAIVLSPRCADPLYRRSVRVSMGHALRVPFVTLADWPGPIDVIRRAGFATVALTPRADSTPLADAVPGERIAFLLGAEGPGLTGDVIASADRAARIPMHAGTDSLNVATAAAIAFYERAESLRRG